jgi:hypothetical protein
MRVLAVTNVYPTADLPACGTYVEQQIKGLRQVGVNVDRYSVLCKGHKGAPP